MESIKEVVEEKVDAVLESSKEDIKDKVEEVVEKVDEVADKVCEKVEAEVVGRIGRLVLMEPEVAKAVELVDEALVGKELTCGCLGWTFSAVKSRKMKATQ